MTSTSTSDESQRLADRFPPAGSPEAHARLAAAFAAAAEFEAYLATRGPDPADDQD